MSQDNNSCVRCGNCCHWTINGIKKKCKYLMKIKSRNLVTTGTTTYCKIYRLESRLYRVLDINEHGEKIYCCRREDTKKHFEGCPLNQ